MSRHCSKGGKQIPNLTKEQEKGLESLKRRVKDGELVILPTDKTGKFAVMTRSTYKKAGLSHIKEDKEVGYEDLWEAQKELNGHMAMLIKCFKIGDK